jgi:PEP-CTERM motif
MKLRLLTLCAASAIGLNAHATTIDWGMHDPFEAGVAIVPVGTFQDFYLFTLPGSFNVSGAAVTNNLTDVLSNVYSDVELLREAGTIDIPVGIFAYNYYSGSKSYNFGTLAAGDYYYKVTGNAQGKLGGSYTFASTMTAVVPEPQTYALFLGGLGALGYVARRRRNGAAAV